MNIKKVKNKTMLTIKNFEKLKREPVGNWVVVNAGTDEDLARGNGDGYVITLRRDGNGDGAAVFINRSEGEKGMYKVKIMYEAWDNEIYSNNYMKEQIQNKDAFLGMVLHKIDTEYQRRISLKS